MNINNIIKELIDKDLIYGITKDSPSSNENDDSIISIDNIISGDYYHLDDLLNDNPKGRNQGDSIDKIDNSNPEDKINI